MARPPDPRLIEFLAPYDRSVASLALGVRDLVLQEAPEAVESIYDAYNAVAIGFSFTGRLKDGFCHIATYAKHVNLGFNRGATMADPQKVLQGTGKSVRHLRIASRADLEASYIREYVRAAIKQVGRPVTPPASLGKAVVKGNYPKKRRPRPVG